MKHIFTTLSGVLALILPVASQANNCPVEKQVYSFKPTGKSFNIGMPPSSKSGYTSSCCPKLEYIKLGDIKGEYRNKLASKAIRTKNGVYLKGEVIPAEAFNKKNIPLYSGKMTCKK